MNRSPALPIIVLEIVLVLAVIMLVRSPDDRCVRIADVIAIAGECK